MLASVVGLEVLLRVLAVVPEEILEHRRACGGIEHGEGLVLDLSQETAEMSTHARLRVHASVRIPCRNSIRHASCFIYPVMGELHERLHMLHRLLSLVAMHCSRNCFVDLFLALGNYKKKENGELSRPPDFSKTCSRFFLRFRCNMSRPPDFSKTCSRFFLRFRISLQHVTSPRVPARMCSDSIHLLGVRCSVHGPDTAAPNSACLLLYIKKKPWYK